MTTSDVTKERVITKYMAGLPVSEIAAGEGLSEATVYNIVNEFISTLGKGSAKVKPLVEAMRRSKLSVAHYTVAVRLLHALIRFAETDESGEPPRAANLDKIVDLLERWLDKCSSGLHDPEEVLRISRETQEICARFEASSPQELLDIVVGLDKRAEEYSATITEQRSEIEELKRETEELVRKRDDALRQSNDVCGKLESYLKTRRRIAEKVKHGDPDTYIVSVAEVIDDMEAEGLDLGTLIPVLKRVTKMQEDEERENKEHLERFEMRQRLEKMHQDYLNAVGDRVACVRTLEELGLAPKEMIELMIAIRDLANATGNRPDDLIKNLTAASKQHFSEQIPERKAAAFIPSAAGKNARRSHDDEAVATTTTTTTTTTTSISTPAGNNFAPGTAASPGQAAEGIGKPPIAAATATTVVERQDLGDKVDQGLTVAPADLAASKTSSTTTTITSSGSQPFEPDYRKQATYATYGHIGPTDNPYIIGLQPVPGDAITTTTPRTEKATTWAVIGSGCSYESTSNSGVG